MNRKTLLSALLMTAMAATGQVQAQTLSEAVVAGLKDNPELGVVLNQLRSREAAVRVAKGGYLPTLDLSAGYGREVTDSPSSRAIDTTHSKELNRGELSLTLRQLIFDGLRTPNDVARTRAERSANRLELLATASDLTLRISEAYLDVLNAERSLALAVDNLAAHERIYSQIKKRTDQGIGSTSELSQVEGRLARAESNNVAAENNLYDAQAAFLRLVGNLPEKLTMPEVPVEKLPLNREQAQIQAEAHHPRLLAARQDLKAAGRQIDQLESNYYPSVYLELRASWNDDLDGAEGHNNDKAALLRFDYNLFNGGRDRNKVREAVGQRGQAADILRNATREVVEGLSLSWNALEALQRQERFLGRHVSASRATLTAYRKQFELGRRSLLDLLDSENELFEAQKDLLAAERDRVAAGYRVLNATGLLLEVFEVDLPEA